MKKLVALHSVSYSAGGRDLRNVCVGSATDWGGAAVAAAFCLLRFFAIPPFWHARLLTTQELAVVELVVQF